jgi:hypothetical protein
MAEARPPPAAATEAAPGPRETVVRTAAQSGAESALQSG